MRKRHAFTLIELLVVIAIISLLVSILLPSLQEARELAKRTACSSNIHQLQVAFFTYDSEYDELPPGNWGTAFTLRLYVDNYMESEYETSKELTLCPSVGEFRASDYYLAWAGDWGFGRLGYNYFGGYGGNGQPDSGWSRDGWYLGQYYWLYGGLGLYPHRRLQDVEDPANLSMFMDFANPVGPLSSAVKPERSSHVGPDGLLAEGENVGFMDGHIEWHEMIPGKTWIVGRDGSGDRFWWTPSFPMPAGATVLN